MAERDEINDEITSVEAGAGPWERLNGRRAEALAENSVFALCRRLSRGAALPGRGGGDGSRSILKKGKLRDWS